MSRSVKDESVGKRRRRLGAAFGAAVVALSIAPLAEAKDALAAVPVVVAPLEPTGFARPVPAWNGFCAAQPHICDVDLAEPARITLDENVWRLLARVNREVNAEIAPVTDMEQWGVLDIWDLGDTGAGDCEDYQLAKRERLVAAGIPRRALRMTVVLDERNEGHAVLKVLTDRGDFVLDNVHDEVKAWDRTPYVYVKREGQSGRAWVSLGGVAGGPAVVAATRR